MCKEPLKLNNHKCLLLKVNQRPRHRSKKSQWEDAPVSRGKWMQIKTMRYHITHPRVAKIQEREHQMLARIQSNRSSRLLMRKCWMAQIHWRADRTEMICAVKLERAENGCLCKKRTYMQILRAAQKSPVWLLVSEWLQEQMMRDGPVPIYIFESIKPWEGTRWHGTKQMKPMKKGHVLCGDIYMTSWKDKAGSNLKKNQCSPNGG